MDPPEDQSDIENTVISKLNQELESDLSKLNNCDNIKNKLYREKERIENSLLLNSSDVPSKISTAIKNVQDTLKKVKNLSEEHYILHKSVDAYEEKVQKVKQIASDYVEKILVLEKYCDYLEVIKEIEELSNSVESAINDKNEKKIVTYYLMLCNIHNLLTDTKCAHLLTYANETVHYWYNIIKEKFITEYEEILKVLKWPYVGNVLVTPPTSETLIQFRTITENLLQIEMDKIKSNSSSLTTESEPPSLPMAQLLKPLRKRFMYHFMGAKQTNRADKPEWYFTQILTWIRDHQSFIELNVQPVYDKCGREKVNAKIEFMKGLVQLALEKLHYELPLLHYDDNLFSHCVDEALGFDRELKNTYEYPSKPGVIEILTKAQIFVKWINMEKRFTLEKMDIILASSTAFNPLLSNEADENRVTECGNSFLTLLSTITQRYEMLPQPGHKLQFLQLQLDLIDDFRVRLLQKLREENSDPLSSNFPNILNTVKYIRDVLNEWSVNTFFLHLQYYKRKAEGKEDETGTVFEEYLILLAKMRDDLLAELVDNVYMEVKAKSMLYRQEKWHAMESNKNTLKLTITATACPMFQVLITKLHKLQEVLAVSLFEQSWKMLANKIDHFLYEEIVSICHFNEGGASQFSYDITKNLFPLFGQYSDKPEVHFKLLKDSAIVLSMSKGMVTSLKQALTEENEESYDSSEILADMAIYTLQKYDILSILNRRLWE